MLADSKINIFGYKLDPQDIRLFWLIFAAMIFAKGAMLMRGFAIDDYRFATVSDLSHLNIFWSQGRYIQGALIWILESLGTNSSDLYFPFGILVLILYPIFIITVFRFIGVDKSRGGALIGAIIVSHPYLTEIFTFRMALPAQSVALFFSIIAIEAIQVNYRKWTNVALSLLAMLAMLLTYQSFLNQIAVTLVFTYLYMLLSIPAKTNHIEGSKSNYRKIITLGSIIVAATLLFLVLLKISRWFGIKTEVRTGLIPSDLWLTRANQLYSALIKIYWENEPIFPHPLKLLTAFLLIISLFIFIIRILSIAGIKNKILAILALVALAPLSIGATLLANEWWPVPRVIAHVSMILGLSLIITQANLPDRVKDRYNKLIAIPQLALFFGFVLISNQVFTDQFRINTWDRATANRIVARLEAMPGFERVKYISIQGGSWGYHNQIRTMQGDMNISAFFPWYSQAALVSEATGYMFKPALKERLKFGEKYCEQTDSWPALSSIIIHEDLAVVCMRRP